MKILIAAFECVPFVKVGGLADVAGSLPKNLRKLGEDARVILPLHKAIDRRAFRLADTGKRFIVPVGGSYVQCGLWETKRGGVTFYFIENDGFFGRDSVYRTPDGDYPDNDRRFILFSRAVLEACKAAGFKPDVIHANDAQAALLPAYLKTLYRIDSFFAETASLFTVHNIAYQCLYPRETMSAAGFSMDDFTAEKFEYYGQMNFLKAGVVYADSISTVSPTYAGEILYSEEHGRGMSGILQTRKEDIAGVLNGIDTVEWDPGKDRIIKKKYSIKKPKEIQSAKAECKTELQKITCLPEDNVPLFGMVSRLDPIKGFDLLEETMPRLMDMPLQLVILGLGDRAFEEKLEAFHKKYRGKFSFRHGFDNELAHRIYAGADFFLMPSRSEPCGLSQMIAMRYGTVPVVHWTGGLADSVEQFEPTSDKGAGFLFREYVPSALLNSVMAAVETYYRGPDYFKTLVLNCIKKDFSWDRPAKKYVKIYGTVCSRKSKEWSEYLKHCAAG